MVKRYSIANARDQLPSLVHEAEEGRAIELTRRGVPVAALVSWRAYETMKISNQGFWKAYENFIKEVDLEEGAVEADTFEGLRDRTEGREVNL